MGKSRTAKAKTKTVDTGGIDTLFKQTMVDLGKTDKGFGDTMDQLKGRMFGIAVPAFAIRYLIGSSMWVMSRVVELFGPPGGTKTTLLGEIFRWHIVNGGYAIMTRTEPKDASHLISTITYDDDITARIQTSKAKSVQQWQTLYTSMLNTFGKQMRPQKINGKLRYGPLAKTCICMGLDSIGAAGHEETMAKIDKKGFAERGFAISAMSISDYSKTLPDKLDDLPISLVFTNHFKPDKEDKGGSYTPSGWSTKYYATLRIKAQKISKLRMRSDGTTGRRVLLKTAKSSLGPDERKVAVNVYYKRRIDEHGISRQYTYWDWHDATIDVLIEQRPYKMLWREINSVIDLHPTKGRKIWSDALGIPEGSPVSYAHAGRRLEACPSILDQLYDIFMIYKSVQFIPGTIYHRYDRDDYRASLPEATNPFAAFDYLDVVGAVEPDDLEEEESTDDEEAELEA